MTGQSDFLSAVLKALDKSGALEDIILIGSWCQYFYRIYFDQPHRIPAVRTMDVDFLIPNPPGIRKEINVPEILKKLDFIPAGDYPSGYTKYVHPELELDFLIPDLGRGRGDKPYKIPQLHVNAVGLRYLNLLQSHTMKITHKGIKVRLPEPAAYILHKFIIQKRRKNKDKKKRDLNAAVEIGEFLLEDEVQKEKLKEVFISLPKKWQTVIKRNLEIHSRIIFDFFK